MRDGYVRVGASDPLWECAACGAVVRNMPRHIGWHLTSQPTPASPVSPNTERSSE